MIDATQACALGAAAVGRVLVVGNRSVDASYRVLRFPRPGETVIAEGRSRDAGGKAVAAARSGLTPALCGAVGSDETGRWLRSRLSDEGLALDGLRGTCT